MTSLQRLTAVLGAIALALGLAGCATAAERRPSATRQAQEVIAFGDSITFGLGTDDPDTQSWPALIGVERVARSGGCLVVDNCWGRPATIDIYRDRVLAKDPDVVIIAFGINDLLASAPIKKIVKGIRGLKQLNHEHGIRTYVATVTPIRLEIDFDPTRRQFNDAVRAAFGRNVIDFDLAMIGPDGSLPHRYDSGDGIHPSALGYEAMARFVKSRLGR